MVLTPSNMPALGKSAPEFQLPDIEGKNVSLADFYEAPALLVAFWCNHCPFVKHINTEFVNFAREYQPRGLATVAISSNDVTMHPDDSPEAMAAYAREHRYGFPYLYDESQQVARDYVAACTPDFFLYDADRSLVYRGQFDGSRPGNDTPVTGADLRAAADALLAGKALPAEQKPSIGCNIKWREHGTAA